MKLKFKIKITKPKDCISYLLAIILSFFLSNSFAEKAIKPVIEKTALPKSVIASLEKNQIPLDSFSVSVTRINEKNKHSIQSLPYLSWRATEAMNPASTIKLYS
jgi:D-alanyl-D-alanine carboxypeptidase/D-alanyl-D-alanine-endopeptidase (penicillin-binding protein 4)